MEQFNQLVLMAVDWVWGLPLIILILTVGILLTFRLRFLQVFRLPRALYYMLKEEEGAHGEVSSWAALVTALSATIGTGNIVGVATAIAAGGPGALFWMWTAAFFGMATKFAEGLLAVKFRVQKEDGTILGGPFFYIERGLGPRWKFLAVLFALFGAFAAISGIGTIAQIQSITSSAQNFFDRDASHILHIGSLETTWSNAIAGLAMTILSALVILGGLKRIAAVCQFIVPTMILIYFAMAMTVFFLHLDKIPEAVREIFIGAFNPSAVTGGAVGSIFIAMQKGIARGIFSNESGLGSAPIVAAAARTHHPTRQGLVSMTGTFIDTIIVCTLTGLTIVMMSAWTPETGLEGVGITAAAFEQGLSFLPGRTVAFLLMICLVFFAFTTTLGWSYYGERCLDYLVQGRKRWILTYRWLYLAVIFIAPYLTVKFVWNMSDLANGLMAFPNLIALLILSGVVAREAAGYFKMLKNSGGKDDEA